MTGFGRSEANVNGRHIIVEIKSVNHKYFEFSSRISRGFNFLEDKLKSFTQTKISRGKVDMYVHIENLEDSDLQVVVNHSVVSGYVNAYKEIAQRYGIDSPITLELVSKNSDAFSIHRKPEDEEAVFEAVKSVLEPAIDSFIRMRELEGQKLFDDIMQRADNIISMVEQVETLSPLTVSDYRTKLETRIKELLADRNIEEQRILTECAIFADKVAVAEETVRLRSHIDQFKKFSTAKNAIGRKMDFLVQEINREVNTIGSKATDSKIAYLVVDMKSEVEKIREQIQNIE